MRKKLLSTLIAGLFVAGPALAQSTDDPLRIQGGATAGGIWTRQNPSAHDTSKLEEYQDLDNGALTSIFLQGRSSTVWFQGYGENFGRSDQYMFLRGGMYDVFKAGGYLNDLPHNFDSNAISPYTGVGTTVLTANFPYLGTGGWTNFNLGYERRDAGGYFEWQRNSPWYFRVDGNEVKFDGTKVGSAALGTSPGNGYIALPIPVLNYTSNVGVEGGYQSTKATLSLRWDYSRFQNQDPTLMWTNPFFGNQLDTTYLPPDNTFNKFTVTGNYRDLPWKSVLSARYTWSKTTSDINLPTSAINSNPLNAANNQTLPSQPTFNGEHVNQALALAWTAVPATNFDTRVFYYWTKLLNNSSNIMYGNYPVQPLPSSLGCGQQPPTPPNANVTWPQGNCEPDLFAYTKYDVGFDAWWRFARGQRLGFGYAYQHLNQERVDYSKATDNKFFVEYKNTMFDEISGRIKYQYLRRRSDHNFSNVGVSPNDPNYLLPYTSAFDMQDQTTNQVKLNLDWTPMPMLGVSFEANWIKQNYDNVTLGRTDNDRQGYYLNGTWGEANKLQINAFGDWEQVKYPSNHRFIGTVSNGPPTSSSVPVASPPGFCPVSGPSTNLNCYDPFAPPVYFVPAGSSSYTGSYNWYSQTKDQTWMLGVGADWPVNDKWLVKLSYIYVSNNGEATFQSQNNFGNPLNIGNWDDTKQQYFNIKATYTLDKHWSFNGGYAYEKFSRNDVSNNGFQYTIPYPAVSTNTGQSYLNGYYLNPNGNQNIFWLTVTYKFDAPPLPVPPLRMAEAPKAAPAPPPPPPPPAPAPPAPQVQKITLDAKALFGFNKSELTPEGRAEIDRQVIARLPQVQTIDVVIVTGHTDRIGSDAYNQKLSEERAAAVGNYLASKGVDKSKIRTIGMGKKEPVVQCDQKNMKALIECLQPNRRVDVEVRGTTSK
jgi:outer membrane protein OmpA-like peptidoglycan-associated protein